MKCIKVICLALILSVSSQVSFAQKFELVPLCGYIFQSTYYGYDGRIEFEGGLALGGLINFKPTKFVEIGINILNQNTTANLIYSSSSLGKDESMEAGIINYQLSLVRNYIKKEDQKVIPFMGLDIGCVQFYGKTENADSYYKMSIGFKGGVKIALSETLNLRIQPQMEMPIQGAGVGIGIGTGGASVGATTYASVVQFGIIGGIGFSLKGKSKDPIPQ